MALSTGKKLNVTEIIIKLADGNDLTFPVKYNPLVRVIRGTKEKNVNNMVEFSLSGEEAMIIVAAPNEIKRLFESDSDISKLIEHELNNL